MTLRDAYLSFPLDPTSAHPPRVYAGIGSRAAPPDVCCFIRQIARVFALRGLTLRSGGAEGADEAFEAGCDEAGGTKEIFLPWQGFQHHASPHFCPPPEAIAMAARYHPNWQACTRAARCLHARNVQQVLGLRLDHPVDFVLFWAPQNDGRVQGGTATAVSVARSHQIPVFNLRVIGIAAAFRAYLDTSFP